MEKDERFAHIATDPKFRRIPKREQKIKIDKRFQSMFKDKKFKVKYTVDKRGRPVNRSSTEDLKRYYEISSDEEESEDDNEHKESEDEDSDDDSKDDSVGKFVRPPKSDSEDEKETVEKDSLKTKHASDKVLPDKIKKKLKNLNVDYARGEGCLLSESSSDDNTEDEDYSDSESVDHGWGELDKDAVVTQEITCRLAVCNMDWDRIRTMDLMVLLNSFVPAGGAIESVTIYPSEFGKERMKEEELRGPIELVESRKEEEDIEENEEGSKYHMEKLRKYQLNRLKYYYAVVVTDKPATANHIYEECDGMEYESTATKMDLRFIPDDMFFEDEPKEVCNNLPEKYEPRYFTTTALQQAKVNLTWDETNLERTELAEKIRSGKIDDISEADLQNYLASSSGEESEDEENGDKNDGNSDDDGSQSSNPIDKYKLLLEEIEKQEEAKKKKDIGMEISWGIDLKEKTDKLVKKKQNDSVEKTPFEEYLDKRKEKKKQKREEKLKQREAINEDEEDGIGMLSDDDIPSDVDIDDPYFAEEFKNSEFKKPKQKKKSKPDNKANEDDGNKAELDLLLMNEDQEEKKHFSLKKIQESEDATKSKKKKRYKKKNKDANGEGGEAQKNGDDFKVNVTDERFSALFSSHHFNIDPTDPHYKKTKGMEALIEEKLKRRTEDTIELNDTSSKKQKMDNASSSSNRNKAELNVLVKSIKRKTEALQNKKKTKT